MFLDDWDADVKRPENAPDDSPTLIDFHAVPKAGSKFHERLVEVKVRTAIPYAYGQYPCYAFPVVQIEAYKQYAAERGLDCELWIVDPDEGKLYFGKIDGKQFIDGREFPFEQMTKRGLMRFYHREQFSGGYDLNDLYPEELAALRAIDIELAGDELYQRLLERFGAPFPDAVLDGLRELQRDFSDAHIFDAVVAFSESEDAEPLIRKLLSGGKSKTLANMFLKNVHGELDKPSKSSVKSSEVPTVKPAEMSLNVLLERLANAVGLSADDLAEAVLEMRQIRFDEQQDQLKARLLGGTKHER